MSSSLSLAASISLTVASLVSTASAAPSESSLFRSLTVAPLDKSRWQIEPILRSIEQNLPIKAIYGTSGKALKTQALIAITFSSF
jgi:hypothetical protein